MTAPLGCLNYPHLPLDPLAPPWKAPGPTGGAISPPLGTYGLEDMLTILKTMNIPSVLIALIKHINFDTETKIMTENGLSEPIRTLFGVR